MAEAQSADSDTQIIRQLSSYASARLRACGTAGNCGLCYDVLPFPQFYSDAKEHLPAASL